VAKVAGGTAVEDRRFPVFAIAAPLGGILLVVLLVKVCGGGSSDDPIQEPAPGTTRPARPIAQQTQQTPTAPQQNPTTPTQPAAPDVAAASAELDHALRLKRFWSTIEISGSQVDVRSGSCDDPAMPGVISGATSVLRGAGLTRLRCLAQSGTVVFERNL
jgi:hypothetical protein